MPRNGNKSRIDPSRTLMVKEFVCGKIYRGKIEQVQKLADLHRNMCPMCSQNAHKPAVASVGVSSATTGHQIERPNARDLTRAYDRIESKNVGQLAAKDVLSKSFTKIPWLTLAPE